MSEMDYNLGQKFKLKSKDSIANEIFYFWLNSSFNSVVECVCLFTRTTIISREQLWENTEHVLLDAIEICSKPHA